MKCVLRNILESNAEQKQILNIILSSHILYTEQSKEKQENDTTIQKWSVFFFFFKVMLLFCKES